MLILIILIIPVVLGFGAIIFKARRTFAVVNAAGYLAVLIAGAILLKEAAMSHSVKACYNFIYIDALSSFFILVIAIVAFAAALYSIGYINRDARSGAISDKKSKVYYLLFNLFCLSMFFVPALNNLGML